MWIIQIYDFIPAVPSDRIYNCLMILRSHTDGKVEEAGRWRQNLQIESAKVINIKSVGIKDIFLLQGYKKLSFFSLLLTFSGNHGVTNGIWNVLLYEWSVSNESGETAPIIPKTPRENWLQTACVMRTLRRRLKSKR